MLFVLSRMLLLSMDVDSSCVKLIWAWRREIDTMDTGTVVVRVPQLVGCCHSSPCTICCGDSRNKIKSCHGFLFWKVTVSNLRNQKPYKRAVAEWHLIFLTQSVGRAEFWRLDSLSAYTHSLLPYHFLIIRAGSPFHSLYIMKHSIFFCIALFSTLMVYYVSAVPLAARSIKSCYKKNARLTQYWIPKEGDKDMLNDGKVVTLSGSKTKKLKTGSGKTIAKVAPVTYDVSLYILH